MLTLKLVKRFQAVHTPIVWPRVRFGLRCAHGVRESRVAGLLARVVPVRGAAEPAPQPSFATLELSHDLQLALDAMNISNATEIQVSAAPCHPKAPSQACRGLGWCPSLNCRIDRPVRLSHRGPGQKHSSVQ
jgi:hypothetical protein